MAQLLNIEEVLSTNFIDNNIRFTLVIQDPKSLEIKLFTSEEIENEKIEALKNIFQPSAPLRSTGSRTPSHSASSLAVAHQDRFPSPKSPLAHKSSSSLDSSQDHAPDYTASISKKVRSTPSQLLDLSKVDIVKRHLSICFTEVQQILCKSISKQWIKIIEPKKQTNHPYKEGDMSKPGWWPSRVRHVEPDHLKKDERIELLISIIMSEKSNLDDLNKSLEYCPNLINEKYKIEVLGEIFYVMENFKRYSKSSKEVDRVITISDFSLFLEFKKNNRNRSFLNKNQKSPHELLARHYQLNHPPVSLMQPVSRSYTYRYPIPQSIHHATSHQWVRPPSRPSSRELYHQRPNTPHRMTYPYQQQLHTYSFERIDPALVDTSPIKGKDQYLTESAEFNDHYDLEVPPMVDQHVNKRVRLQTKH